MSDNNRSLRHPESIDNLNELEVARRKAEINASHDRLLLTQNLAELRQEGPGVLLKNVVLPVVGIGVAVYGVSKLVGSLTRDDDRDYYVEPYDEDSEHADDERLARAAARRGRANHRLRAYPSNQGLAAVRPSRRALDFSKYIPAALIIAKMGVGYLEKKGTRVPQAIHDLLSGPGVSSSQHK